MPREGSTGKRRRQGGITKTGNTHARRLMVEAAWHQRRPLRASAPLERRRQGQPAAVRARLTRAPDASTTAGRRLSAAASDARSSPSPWRGSWPGTAGRWRPWSSGPHLSRPAGKARRRDARSDPRDSYEQPTGRCSTLEGGSAPDPHPVMRSQPAHISRDHRVADCQRALPAHEEGPQTASLQSMLS